MPDNLKDYIVKQVQCTQWEYEEEENSLAQEMALSKDDASESKGLKFSQLKIHSTNPGFGGQYLIELFKKRNTYFSFGAIKSGCLLGIYCSKTKKLLCEGTTHTIERVTLKVIVAEPLEKLEDEYGYTVELRPNRVTLDRMLDGMKQVSALPNNHILSRILLGQAITSQDCTKPLTFAISNKLNHSQQKAVELSCDGEPLTIIHGPPGTGKTSSLLYIIGSYASQGKKVLVAAGSNAAVDHIALSLKKMNAPIIRVGNPERFHPELQEHTLENMACNAPSGKKVAAFKQELEQEVRKKNKRMKNKKFIRQEDHRGDLDLIKSYKAEIKRLEDLCINELHEMGFVFIATHTGAGHTLLKDLSFDVIIAEEAGQTLEPLMYLSMIKSKKWVIAGDHLQLPPVVVSEKAKEAGFEESLMEKLAKLYPHRVTMLNVQYRMHEQIQNFSSQYFYNKQLICGPNISERKSLTALQSLKINSRVLFIDTKEKNFLEKKANGGLNNPQEANQLADFCKQLLNAGVAPAEIGVIAPYRGQVQILKSILPDQIEVSTVDSYQGREKEIILISLTRSNQENDIGFLSEIRRMNVAITRAKEFLWVIGNSETVTSHHFYQEFLNYTKSLPEAYSILK